MFEVSYHLFKEINPLSKYAAFTFYDAAKPADFWLYTEKQMIVKFCDKYYIYKGNPSFSASEKQKQFILVTKGKKTVIKID